MSWETPRLNLLRTRILADFGSAACMGLGFAPEGWLGGDTSLRQRMGRLEPISFFDLLDASLPRFELLDPEGYNAVTVQPSRGCSHRCEHCADSIFLTPRCQLQPVEKGTENRHDIQKTWTCTWRAEDFGRSRVTLRDSRSNLSVYGSEQTVRPRPGSWQPQRRRNHNTNHENQDT